MENVGDGEVVLKRGGDQHDCGQEDDGKRGDSSAASSFTQAGGTGSFTRQRQ